MRRSTALCPRPAAFLLAWALLRRPLCAHALQAAPWNLQRRTAHRALKTARDTAPQADLAVLILECSCSGYAHNALRLVRSSEEQEARRLIAQENNSANILANSSVLGHNPPVVPRVVPRSPR